MRGERAGLKEDGYSRATESENRKKKMEGEIQEGDGGTSEERRAIFSSAIYFFNI